MKKLVLLLVALSSVNIAFADNSFIVPESVDRGNDFNVTWEIENAVSCRPAGDRLDVTISNGANAWSRFVTLLSTHEAIFDTTSKSVSRDQTQLDIGLECFDGEGVQVFSETKQVDIIDPVIDIWIESIGIKDPLDIKKGQRVHADVVIGVTGLSIDTAISWKGFFLSENRKNLDRCSIAYFRTKIDTTKGGTEYVSTRCQTNYFLIRDPRGARYMFEVFADYDKTYREIDETNNTKQVIHVIGANYMLNNDEEPTPVEPKVDIKPEVKSPETTQLDFALATKLDKALSKLYSKVDPKHGSSSLKKQYYDKLLARLDGLLIKRPKQTVLIRYIIDHVNNHVQTF